MGCRLSLALALCTGFHSHHAVAQMAGNVLLRLSDSLFLPLNVEDYSETLHSFLQAVQRDMGAVLEQRGISLGAGPDLGAWGPGSLHPLAEPLAVPHSGSGESSGEV